MEAIFTRRVKQTETDIYSFYFKPEKSLRFIAGQYTELSIGIGLNHWFTISSNPNEAEISITTRLTGHEFKNRLNELKKGDEVKISEPMGDFVLPIDPSVPIIMVAAGIGITPVLSILKDLTKTKEKRQINVIYSAAVESDFIDLSPYRAHIKRFIKIVGRRIISKDVLKLEMALKEPLIYISGPEGVVEDLIKVLKKSDIASNRLIGDYFPGYERS